MELTHFNQQGRAQMVDISAKDDQRRVAIARTHIQMKPTTRERIRAGGMEKGDVLAVAQVAGIMAAKKTSDIIPMCHPIALTGVDIRFEDVNDDTIQVDVTVKTTGKTGVEMEALTSAQVVGLTIYDMCKAIDKEMVLGPTYLLQKQGGKSGDYHRASAPQ